MKKYIKYLIVLILIIPIFIYADTYNDAENIVRGIFNKEEYVNTWNRYLKTSDSNRHGELITLGDYKLSMKKGKTYLFYGLEYWTSSKDESGKVYAIRIQTNSEINSNSLNYSGTTSDYNTRVVVQVKPDTKVRGSGTYKDPWSFNPVYKVTAEVNSTKYGNIIDRDAQYRDAMCSLPECTAKIRFTINDRNRYLDNDCLGKVITAKKEENNYYEFTVYENGIERKATASSEIEEYRNVFRNINTDGEYGDAKNVGIIMVSNIRRNTTCHITLGTGYYKIEVPGSEPDTIYLRYAENYYKDEAGKEVIKELTTTPSETGYTYKGYKYRETTIIDGKNILPNTKHLFTEDATLTVVMEGNKYHIAYDYDGGSRGTENPTEIIYDEIATITHPAKTGYDFTGWDISGLTNSKYVIEGVTKPNPVTETLTSVKSTKYKNLRTDTGTVNFKATWSAKEVTVTYNAKGGSVSPSSKKSNI